MEWAFQQQEAISTIAAWMKIRYSPFFYLAGYAGTGKTTLARHVAGLQDGKVRYAAFTGKAAKVMKNAGCAGAQTIHSLIYDTNRDEETGVLTVTLNDRALDGVSLVVIDECSMVNEEVGRDLLSFGVPILVLGDPFQLPPVKGAGFFTSGRPAYMLTDVHRQGRDSPIIRLATDIRQGTYRRTESSEPGMVVTGARNLDRAAVIEADTIIVGKNDTRAKYNRRIRELRNFTKPTPQVGETVICLKNNKELGISNGEVFEVSKLGRSKKDGIGRIVGLVVAEPDNPSRKNIPVRVREQLFTGSEDLDWKQKRGTEEFAFGYCLTTHKSQGSQWPKVCVFDESRVFGEHAANHLYTAVTRASEHLTLVI